MNLFMTHSQIYSIIQRFDSKYKYRKSNRIRETIVNIQNIIFIEAYIIPCIYSNQCNLQKENIIIKFKIKKNESIDEIVSLNILYDDYKDLL